MATVGFHNPQGAALVTYRALGELPCSWTAQTHQLGRPASVSCGGYKVKKQLPLPLSKF